MRCHSSAGDEAIEAAMEEPRYEVAQKTPSRVAHRRADKVRGRWVELMTVERGEGDDLVVVMRTQAGTYVKEAISGEGGMTEPSLAEVLGIDGAECVELDVLAILGEEGEEDESPARLEPPRTVDFGAGLE